MKIDGYKAIHSVLNPEPKSSYELFDVKPASGEDDVELITQFSSKLITVQPMVALLMADNRLNGVASFPPVTNRLEKGTPIRERSSRGKIPPIQRTEKGTGTKKGQVKLIA